MPDFSSGVRLEAICKTCRSMCPKTWRPLRHDSQQPKFAASDAQRWLRLHGTTVLVVPRLSAARSRDLKPVTIGFQLSPDFDFATFDRQRHGILMPQ